MWLGGEVMLWRCRSHPLSAFLRGVGACSIPQRTSSPPDLGYTAPMTTSAGILSGLRVIEVSAFVAAPLAGATLAELGADVIRIDPPGGGVDINRWPLHN